MKNIPQRTCMGCNTKKDKKDLIRIVRRAIWAEPQDKETVRRATLAETQDTENENASNNSTQNDKYEIIIDKTGKQEGRGAYICNSVQCLEKVVKSKRLERSLGVKISEEIYSNLKKKIDGGEFIG